MINPRQLLAITLTAALIYLSSSVHDSRAMSSHAGAIASSQFDERAWHYLGLALSRNGKLDDARKAYEKAAKMGTQLIAYQLERLTSPAELYRRINPLRTVLGEAADSADKYLELSSKPSRAETSEWRERADLLRTFEELSDELKDSHVYGALEVTTKARKIKFVPAVLDGKPVSQFVKVEYNFNIY